MKRLKPILFIEGLFSRLGLGMRAKLITLFVVIKVIPLILLALLAWHQSLQLGRELQQRTAELTAKAHDALSEAGGLAINDAVNAMDIRATADIERMTTDAARNVADFLYDRDDDIRFLAALRPDPEVYRGFVQHKRGLIIKPGDWALNEDETAWVPVNRRTDLPERVSSIVENELSFNYRPPDDFEFEARPLYLEATFVDLNGRELIKVTTSPQMDPSLKNIALRQNTYVKAETYWPDLQNLQPGEIYVSEVIGAYTPSRLIGMYTPANAAKLGITYAPEQAAYAGMENPYGVRFKGLIRWATPLTEDGRIIGYVTLALDHDHIMEFTDHIMPTSERYTEIPDAFEGNYAFIWDYLGRSICHPRHHSITGYNPETGQPEIPWLEDRIYDEWQASGLSYVDFIKNVPVFREQSRSKKPAPQLTAAGLVGLDCRYLNNAPQCTGWFDLTQDGGSGSFVILWSGLRKLTTAAAIPYYTGRYGESPRGFGFVAIGAGLEHFHRPAMETQEKIDAIIAASDSELANDVAETKEAIDSNLWNTAISLATSTVVMGLIVIMIAIWMASVFTRRITNMINGISRFRSGERHFRFNAANRDEMGALADSFDDMADSVNESVGEPLAITDLNKTVLYMNEEWLAMLGKTLPEVLGRPYDENRFIAAGSDYSPLKALLNNTKAQFWYHAPSGKYFRGIANYLKNKAGRSIGYVITIADVTEIALVQKRTEDQRAILDTIFTFSPDLIWIKDSSDCYLMANPRFASLVGVNPEDLKGASAAVLFPAEQVQRFKKRDQAAIDNKGPWYNEETLHFADGHTETVDAVRTPLFNAEGECIGILGVARDVSGRVAVENELRSTQLELEKAVISANLANESKSEFLARMSHEIRTPMNAIIGMTNITKRKLEEDNFDRNRVLSHIHQIEVSSKHLLGLLNDILDISKIEAGKIELVEEAFDLAKLVESVAAIIHPRCVEKNINFVINVSPLSENVFTSDALRLRQVLINLLGNAVKFTEECGEITFTLTEKAKRGGKTLIEFAVADTGIGIAPENVPNLFTPFEQGAVWVARRYGGTGLGLSISKNIVNMMGSDIQVVSEVGAGSTFTFALWLTDAGEARDNVVAGQCTDNFENCRLLLVDDVDINRMIVTEMLAKTGVIIDEADSGQLAVEMFKAQEPGYYDLIFMDIQMPGIDGYEAVSIIRGLEHPDAQTIPILAMTANAFKEDVDKSLAHGMNGHLAKPLEYEKILEVLSRFLGGPRKL